MTELARSLAYRRGSSQLLPARPKRIAACIAAWCSLPLPAKRRATWAASITSPIREFPLNRTPAMLNFDMLGRLRQDRLTIKGAATGANFAELVERTNRPFGFHLTETPGGYSPTDQATFYARGIPAMDFFTGMHVDYHEPTDTFDKLNLAGMRRIEQFVEELTVALADGQQWPTYVALPLPSANDGRCYFGSIPDLSRHGDGYALAGVAPGGPARGRAFAAAT